MLCECKEKTLSSSVFILFSITISKHPYNEINWTVRYYIFFFFKHLANSLLRYFFWRKLKRRLPLIWLFPCKRLMTIYSKWDSGMGWLFFCMSLQEPLLRSAWKQSRMCSSTSLTLLKCANTSAQCCGRDDTTSTPQDAHTGAEIDVEVKRASNTVTKWKRNASASDLALVNRVRQTSGTTDGEPNVQFTKRSGQSAVTFHEWKHTCPSPVSLRVARPPLSPFAWPWTHLDGAQEAVCVMPRILYAHLQTFGNSYVHSDTFLCNNHYILRVLFCVAAV